MPYAFATVKPRKGKKRLADSTQAAAKHPRLDLKSLAGKTLELEESEGAVYKADQKTLDRAEREVEPQTARVLGQSQGIDWLFVVVTDASLTRQQMQQQRNLCTAAVIR